MNTHTIRPLDPSNPREMNTVVIYSMMTLWESTPELRVDPSTIPDFGYDTTRSMYEAGIKSPQQRYLVALDDVANLVGHSVSVLRRTDDDELYGFFWSRYVHPDHRRQGIGRRFLQDTVEWFASLGAQWGEVHVHVENQALRALFASQGFEVKDRRADRWTYLVMRKDV